MSGDDIEFETEGAVLACCRLCGTPLNLPNRPWTDDCGGDCAACMAEHGDPDCIATLAKGWVPVQVFAGDKS